MARQTELSIQRDKLGGLATAPDLAQVEVLINGAVADRIRAGRDVVTVRAPPTGDGPWIILLTTPGGKKLLRALDLHYDQKAETFGVKQQQGSGTKEPTSDDQIDKAAQKIATAIREVARALTSQVPAKRAKSK